MPNDEELLAKMREYQKNSFGAFELVFTEKMDYNQIQKELTAGDDYWMTAIENDFRYTGVELPSFNRLSVVLDEDYKGQWCFITVPDDSDVSVVLNFANRFKCNIYINGDLVYKYQKRE